MKRDTYLYLPKPIIFCIPHAWMFFVAAFLMSVTNFSKLTRDWAVLLYPILEVLSIDMRQVILHNNQHIGCHVTFDGIGHPWVIIELRRKVNVAIDDP